MRDSLKIAKLDFLTSRSQNAIYLVAVSFVFMYRNSPLTLVGLNIAWLIALMSSGIFALQEINHLDQLYGSLSINIKSIVLGRYLNVVMSFVITFIASVALYSGIHLMDGKTVNLSDIFLAFSISFLIFIAMIGLEMPLFFKKGYTKGKVWFMFIFIAVLALALIPYFIPTLAQLLQPIIVNQGIAIIACILVSCIIWYISYRISLVAYLRRE